MRYLKMMREFGLRKPEDIRKYNMLEDWKGLPRGAVLHTSSGFTIGYGVDNNVVPDDGVYANIWGNSVKKKMALFITEATVEPVNVSLDGVRFIKAGIASEIKRYRTKSNVPMRFAKDHTEFVDMEDALNIVAHEPLDRMAVRGLLKEYRAFNIRLASLLNNISIMPDRQHFMVFNVDDIQFSITDFNKTYKKHDKVALTYIESDYYLLMVHLMGFLQDDPTESLFESLPQHALETTNIILVNEDKFRLLRLDILKRWAQDKPGFDKKFMTSMNQFVSISNSKIQEEIKEELLKPQLSQTGNNVNSFDPSITEEELTERTNAVQQKRTADVLTKIFTDPDITDKKREYIAELATNYRKIEVGGVKMTELLEGKVSQEIKSESLEDIDGLADLPDKSVLKGSITDSGAKYMQEMFLPDLAKQMTSYSANGWFVQDLNVEDVSDTQSNLIEVSAKFKDVNGESTTIKYTLPKVDDQGMCKINGNLKRMVNQRLNLPICKVSDDRVALSSNLIKTMVYRNASFSNSLAAYMTKLIELSDGAIYVVKGSHEYTDKPLPYEYSTMALKYSKLTVKGKVNWSFDFDNRFDNIKDEEELKLVKSYEKTYGVYVGSNKTEHHYFDTEGNATRVSKGDAEPIVSSMLDILKEALPDVTFRPFNEWVNVKILNKNIPVIIVLGHMFGLTAILKYLKIDYEVVDLNARVQTSMRDIVIRFSDSKVIFSNLTNVQRLIVSGLSFYKYKDFLFTDMDNSDDYYELILQRRIGANYVNAISETFETFMDPITEEILISMNEPTNFRDLLIRATVMLTTRDFNEPSANANMRNRNYERFNTIAHKQIMRAMMKKKRSISKATKFSVPPYEILTAIVTDPLMENVDIINPIHEAKSRLMYSHQGEGGRSKDSMVIKDRRFPSDGAGVISEAVKDSGDVGIAGFYTMTPNIHNMRGMSTGIDPTKADASDIYSITTNLFPGANHDSGNREFYAVLKSL